jgi:hypothetical protein
LSNMTRKEAAAELNVSARWLSDFVREEGIVVLHAGHRLLFDAASMALITEKMRRPIASSRQVQNAGRHIGRSEARKTGCTWIEVHQRAIDAKRRRG